MESTSAIEQVGWSGSALCFDFCRLLTGFLFKVLILAKGVKGRAAVALIQQAISNPSIYHFGEILDHENIGALEQSADLKPYLDLLKIFAYGTLSEYRANSSLPPIDEQQVRLPRCNSLTQKQERKFSFFSFFFWNKSCVSTSSHIHQFVCQCMKLKQLTIISLAAENKVHLFDSIRVRIYQVTSGYWFIGDSLFNLVARTRAGRHQDAGGSYYRRNVCGVV